MANKMPAIILFGVLTLMPLASTAQNPVKDSYARAIEAIDRGDCVAAINELETYKKEAANVLKNNSKFAALIEQQLDLCRKSIAQPPSGIHLWGYLSGNPVANDPGAGADTNRAANVGRRLEFRGF